MATSQHSGFYCQECGHGFRTVKAAERASFGERGCPKCGGADIDLGKPGPYRAPKANANARLAGAVATERSSNLTWQLDCEYVVEVLRAGDGLRSGGAAWERKLRGLSIRGAEAARAALEAQGFQARVRHESDPA